MNPFKRFICFSACLSSAFLFAGPANATAPVCQWHSPPWPMIVAELYTSEGCSSCPPADRWFASHLKTPDLQNRVLALAFHVDYWNYLGWSDPYSSAVFSQRQRNWQSRGVSPVVYTPEFIFSGHEDRNWHTGGWLANALKNQTNKQAPVQLLAAIQPERSPNAKSLRLEIRAHWNEAPYPIDVEPVIYEDDLTQQISAGENGGETLHHEGVVRLIGDAVTLDKARPAVYVDVPIQAEWNTRHLGLGLIGSVNEQIVQALHAPKFLNQCKPTDAVEAIQ